MLKWFFYKIKKGDSLIALKNVGRYPAVAGNRRSTFTKVSVDRHMDFQKDKIKKGCSVTSLKKRGQRGNPPKESLRENLRHKDFQSFALPTELSALQKSEPKNKDFSVNLKNFFTNKLAFLSTLHQ